MKPVKLRAWTKEEIPTLAKYLNNKRFVTAAVTPFLIHIRKRSMSNSSVPLKGKANRTITASSSITKQKEISVLPEVRT